ncbi:MAG TPA: phosphate-binding protein, partial [Gammaproteobacteria bacterium]|nr:phosphate-binding protein [Gammaproteobacteria bacterium]
MTRKFLALGAGLVLSVSAFGQALQVDPALPDYKPASGVSGNLKSIGSDTLNNLMALWAEGFRSAYPNVQIEIEGKGSGTAPPALIGGNA